MNIERFDRIDAIDPMVPGRSMPSAQEREKERARRQERAREEGYQKLLDLCLIAEPAAAKRLAQEHSEWGYEIVDGWVYERSPDVNNA